MANSTTQFLDRIKAYQFNPSDFMVSFDVVSLFTNVPLKETIDIIANYIYDENHNLPIPPFGKLIFKRMMRLATGGIFMHTLMYWIIGGGVATRFFENSDRGAAYLLPPTLFLTLPSEIRLRSVHALLSMLSLLRSVHVLLSMFSLVSTNRKLYCPGDNSW